MVKTTPINTPIIRRLPALLVREELNTKGTDNKSMAAIDKGWTSLFQKANQYWLLSRLLESR